MELHILGDNSNIETLVDAEGKVFVLLTKELRQRLDRIEFDIQMIKDKLCELNKK